MSTYSMLHGINPHADWIISRLDLDRPAFGRFRDAALYEDKRHGYLIRVTTRNAGSREQFKHITTQLTEHKLFLSQEDDSFDDTYKYYYFKLPPIMVEEINNISSTKLKEMVDNTFMKDKTASVTEESMKLKPDQLPS